MKIAQLLVISIFILPVITSCGNSAVRVLKNEIKKRGYIMYQNPLEDARTGTLVGGSPSFQAYISHSTTCFKDDVEGFEKLRRVSKVTLPNIAKTIHTSGSVNAELMEVLGTGSSPIGGGIDFNRIKSINLTFSDVEVEYIDLVLLKEYYHSIMSDDCKQFLDTVGFVVQAIKVGKMTFTFNDQQDVKIGLTSPVVEDLLDINADIEWSVKNEFQLEIKSPKYLGFQLGQIRLQDEGVAIYRATTVKKDKYQFESISIFKTDANRTKMAHKKTHPHWFVHKDYYLENHSDYKD